MYIEFLKLFINTSNSSAAVNITVATNLFVPPQHTQYFSLSVSLSVNPTGEVDGCPPRVRVYFEVSALKFSSLQPSSVCSWGVGSI